MFGITGSTAGYGSFREGHLVLDSGGTRFTSNRAFRDALNRDALNRGAAGDGVAGDGVVDEPARGRGTPGSGGVIAEKAKRNEAALQETANERIRVLVVGESPLARGGLEAAISQSGLFEVVGTCNLAESAALFDSSAVDVVLMESSTFSAWMPSDVTSGTVSGPKHPPAPLTPREIEVLRLLADGDSNKIIAHKLGISDHTVKFHVTSILSKLNAASRTEAVTLGVRMGIIYL